MAPPAALLPLDSNRQATRPEQAVGGSYYRFSETSANLVAGGSLRAFITEVKGTSLILTDANTAQPVSILTKKGKPDPSASSGFEGTSPVTVGSKWRAKGAAAVFSTLDLAATSAPISPNITQGGGSATDAQGTAVRGSYRVNGNMLVLVVGGAVSEYIATVRGGTLTLKDLSLQAAGQFASSP